MAQILQRFFVTSAYHRTSYVGTLKESAVAQQGGSR